MKLPDENYRYTVESRAEKQARRMFSATLGALVVAVLIGVGFVQLVNTFPPETRAPLMIIVIVGVLCVTGLGIWSTKKL